MKVDGRMSVCRINCLPIGYLDNLFTNLTIHIDWRSSVESLISDVRVFCSQRAPDAWYCCTLALDIPPIPVADASTLRVKGNSRFKNVIIGYPKNSYLICFNASSH